jgi:uncharacterized protein (DUF1778 family)
VKRPPSDKRIHVQLTRDDLKLLDDTAKALSVTRTSVVRILIRKHCKKLLSNNAFV